MIIIDTELKTRAAEGRPIRVGMAGAGFMGRGIVNQLANYLPGMRLAGIYSRNPEQGLGACTGAGMTVAEIVGDLADLDSVIARGGCAVTSDYRAALPVGPDRRV